MPQSNPSADAFLDTVSVEPDTPPDQQADPAPVPAAEPTGSDPADTGQDPTSLPEDPAQPPSQDERPPRSVPIQALDEARGQTADLKAQLEEERASKARMEKAYEAVVAMAQGQGQAQQPQQPQQPEIPSYDDDPAEHLRVRQEMLDRQVAEMSQQGQVQQAQSHAQMALVARQQAYMETHPDYPQALDHVRKLTTQSNVLAGMDPTAAAADAEQRLFYAAVQAMNNGQDPAKMVYEQAKLVGFQGGAAPAATTATQQAAQQLKAVQQGQQANKSLSDGGGQAAGQPMTLEDLANLSDKEMLDPKNWDRIVGASMNRFDMP